MRGWNNLGCGFPIEQTHDFEIPFPSLIKAQIYHVRSEIPILHQLGSWSITSGNRGTSLTCKKWLRSLQAVPWANNDREIPSIKYYRQIFQFQFLQIKNNTVFIENTDKHTIFVHVKTAYLSYRHSNFGTPGPFNLKYCAAGSDAMSAFANRDRYGVLIYIQPAQKRRFLYIYLGTN